MADGGLVDADAIAEFSNASRQQGAWNGQRLEGMDGAAGANSAI